MTIASPMPRLLRRETIRTAIQLVQVTCLAGAALLLGLAIKEGVDGVIGVQKSKTILDRIPANLAARSGQTDGQTATRDFAVLVERSIFGKLEVSRPTTQGPTAKPVAINQLSLIGTFLEKNQSPYAIIEDKKKNNQEVFNLGELVFGDARLKTVLSDRVELERQGKIEVLMLDEFSTSSGGGAASAGSDDSQTQFEIEETELDKVLENIPLVLTQARAVPYFKDGVSVGLRLFAIKSGSIYERLGLKNGDILLSLNDNNLGDITQAARLFEKLKEERSMSLKLQRNLEDKSFHYEIR